MKKLIIFFFMVALVGCNSTSTLILDSPMIEEEICVDDCVTSKAEIYPYFVDYHSRLEEIKDEIAPERNSSSINQFYSNTVYDRDEIITSDPVTGNSDILSYMPADEFSAVLSFAYDIVRFCIIDEPCENPMFPPGSDIIEFNFGFNSSGGYVTYTLDESSLEMSKTSIQFIIDEDQEWYEMIEYDLDGGNFEYVVYSDGIYQKYRYTSDTIYSFNYIDTITQEKFIYQSSETGKWMFYYNPNNQYSYIKIDSGQYYVKKMDQMEMIVQLKKVDEEYSIGFNFNLIQGWDQFLSSQPERPYNSILYNSGDEVFTDYTFNNIDTNLRYTTLVGTMILSEDELQNYTFPQGFTYEISMDDLLQELTALQDEQFPYNSYGFSEEDILPSIKQLQAKFLG